MVDGGYIPIHQPSISHRELGDILMSNKRIIYQMLLEFVVVMLVIELTYRIFSR